MQKRTTRTENGKGQVRGEKRRAPLPHGVKRNETGAKVERVNGAPVYTAIYKVNRSEELLEFLLRKANTSRNNVKSLLVRRQVLVNGSVVTQYNFVLAKDDEVKLSRRPVKDAPTAKQEKRTTKPAPRNHELKVIYEDDDFIAIDKPVGLLSVESDKESECAFGYVFDYLQKKDKHIRPFILHRIDKETSGVLVFAKNVKVHSMLKMHWNEQVQRREYYAVVEGTFTEKKGTFVNYLKENQNNLVFVTNDPSCPKAITHYEVIRETDEFSLLRVEIETGRKNQIRVQMKAKGHAVVGDEKYGFEKNPLGRLGLHASQIEFIHPISKELITIRATLPQVFRQLFGQ
jgi:23S rRNA pseudouridine1911/1915/1917 synthase